MAVQMHFQNVGDWNVRNLPTRYMCMASDISADMGFVANRFEYGCILAASTFLTFC